MPALPPFQTRSPSMHRRTVLAASAAGLAAPFLRPAPAEAQPASRAETLLLVQEYGPNSMDMQGIGSGPDVMSHPPRPAPPPTRDNHRALAGTAGARHS